PLRRWIHGEVRAVPRTRRDTDDAVGHDAMFEQNGECTRLRRPARRPTQQQEDRLLPLFWRRRAFAVAHTVPATRPPGGDVFQPATSRSRFHIHCPPPCERLVTDRGDIAAACPRVTVVLLYTREWALLSRPASHRFSGYRPQTRDVTHPYT